MMVFLFYFSLFTLCYTFLIYPLTLLLCSVFLAKKVDKKPFYPYVSIIISAYNEENIIKEKLDNTLLLDYPKDKLEIIVASESVDATNKIVESYADKGIVLYVYKNREGKRATLYKTVPKAKGEIIIFSDANGLYEKESIKKIMANFNDNRIGCVSGRLKYIKNTGKDNLIASNEATYWEIDFILKQAASSLFSLAGCGGVNGSIFAIRKELYNPIDKYRGDDFEISARIEIAGYGVVMEKDAISYETVCDRTVDEFSRKIRLASWNLYSAVLLLKEAVMAKRVLTAILLLSHRILRYFTPVCLILLLFGNVFYDIGIFRILLLLQILFYGLAMFGFICEKCNIKLHSKLLFPSYFVMVNFAAFIAIFNILTGKQNNFWIKNR